MAAEPRIICEDESVLVIDKPGGMPSASLDEGEAETVASWLIAQHPELRKLPRGELEAGLANRLDNDTSGILLAGRTPAAYESLRRQFAEGSVKKEYAALVVGSPPDEGSIDAPIAHHPRKKRKMVACESDARAEEWRGRPAETRFCVRERFASSAGEEYALLSVRIATGVRHQIRVHLAHIGHPIAGDGLYQNPKKRAADPLELGRNFLHASKVALSHPETGERIEFSSPLPDDLRSALEALKRR